MNQPAPHPGAIYDGWSTALCSDRVVDDYVAAP